MRRSKSNDQVVPGWRQPATLLSKGVYWFLSLISAAMVGFMMFLTFADVLGRYVFNSPILGAYELTEVLMGLMIFGGLPLISLKGSNITVDLLVSSLSPPMKKIQQIIVDVACGLVAAVLGWRAFIYAHRMREAGERTLQLKLSWGVIIYIISILLFITAWFFFINIRSTLKSAALDKTEE